MKNHSVFLPAIFMISVIFVSGCTQAPSGDTVLDDGTILKEDGTIVKPDGAMVKPDGTMVPPGDSMMENKTGGMMGGSSGSFEYSGTLLAGSSAPLIDFNLDDYNSALDSDRLVVLYFYADWCPICRAEVPQMYGAFNQLTTDRIVGFRVNFNDGQTDDNERNLAREFGVAYQHTKVFLKNGGQVYKSPESWNRDRYISEINRFLV